MRNSLDACLFILFAKPGTLSFGFRGYVNKRIEFLRSCTFPRRNDFCGTLTWRGSWRDPETRPTRPQSWWWGKGKLRVHDLEITGRVSNALFGRGAGRRYSREIMEGSRAGGGGPCTRMSARKPTLSQREWTSLAPSGDLLALERPPARKIQRMRPIYHLWKPLVWYQVNYPSLHYLREQTPRAVVRGFPFLPQPLVSHPRAD